MISAAHAAYVKALRARHQRDRAEIRAALAGRHPQVLADLKRLHFEVERETRRVLERVSS